MSETQTFEDIPLSKKPIRLNITLSTSTENRLRKYTGRKGDLMRISEEAFRMWLDVKECVVKLEPIVPLEVKT